MFRFEHIEYLYYLGAIPFLLVIYYLYRYRVQRSIQEFGDASLFQRLSPDVSWWRRNLKFFLLVFAIILLIFAYANPQWGSKKEKVKAESSDIFIALDISQSMMAEDISPNRLERAKRFTQSLIQELRGNRIGLIYFAGGAYLQMPLSSDYAAAQLFIQSANTGQAGTQGTNIAEAIDLAQRAFQEEERYQRAMIIITDGENHDPAAIDRIEQAREDGLVVFTIGIGTEEGGFIPFTDRGREQYKRDQEGKVVKSKLNIELLKQMAAAGDGQYYLIQEGNKIIEDLEKRLEKLEKKEVEQRSFSEYTSYFQYFLGLAILLLVIEYFLSDKSKNRIKRIFNVG